MKNNAEVIMHLSLIPGVGPAAIAKLLAACTKGTIFGDSFDILYGFSQSDVQNYGKLSSEAAERIIKGLACKRLLEQELKLIERHKIEWVVFADKRYPEVLSTIHMPPMILYYKGAVAFDARKKLAIVGSRAADHYGRAVIASYIPDFVQAGYAIISGGAIGIDAYAHQAAIQSGGITGAVLGSGLLKLYPDENKALFEKIVDSGGYLMSSFPLLMEPLPQFFPARNRIIAGISRGTLVVQAAAKSGALITAKHALEEGREVFAVPGRVDNPLSAGCHALLSEGATIATSASDVLAVLEADYTKAREIGKKAAVNRAISHEKHQMTIPHSIDTSDPRNLLYALCFEPQSMEELMSKSGLDMPVIQEHLWSLMTEGKMSQSILGLWKCV